VIESGGRGRRREGGRAELGRGGGLLGVAVSFRGHPLVSLVWRSLSRFAVLAVPNIRTPST
jgi:hypothetical protein